MPIPETLLDIRSYSGGGYLPLIDFGDWRVAVLRYSDAFMPLNLDSMERHDETDEVFVLLAGRCTLLIGEGQERIACIHAEDMEPLKLYNVKKGCWHAAALSPDATVLIVENRDTTTLNSPKAMLDARQREKIVKDVTHSWSAP